MPFTFQKKRERVRWQRIQINLNMPHWKVKNVDLILYMVRLKIEDAWVWLCPINIEHLNRNKFNKFLSEVAFKTISVAVRVSVWQHACVTHLYMGLFSLLTVCSNHAFTWTYKITRPFFFVEVIIVWFNENKVNYIG